MDQLATSPPVVDGIDPKDALNLMTPKSPPGLVRVRGQVDSLQPWWSPNKVKSEVPDYYFGTLSSLSNEASIDFKCAGYAAPDVGQLAVFEGALTYEGRGNRSGLKVLLSGNYVGTFTIPDAVEAPLRPQDRAPKKPLINYLEEKDGSLQDIFIVGSEAGISDLKNSVGDDAANLRFEKISFTNFKRVMEIIRGAPCDAVVLARGGDDDAPNFSNQRDCIRQLLASGKYFYTALGHAQRLTLADLFADQAFLTPAHCGQSIAAVLAELKIKKELRLAVEDKNREVAELQEARETDQMWHDRKVASQMFEYNQLKGKAEAELAMLIREKRRAKMWATLFALIGAILLAVLLAFVFDVGGIREWSAEYLHSLPQATRS